MTSSLQKKVNHGKLSLANPDQIMGFAHILKGYIEANKLSIDLEGKKYPLVDAWKFAGINFGLTGIPEAPIERHSGEMMTILTVMKTFKGKHGPYEKEVDVFTGLSTATQQIEDARLFYGPKIKSYIIRPFYNYKCNCNIVRIAGNNKSIISFGQGICSNLEEGKHAQSESAINSMAQTRSISKGFRNVLGFVMSSAGYENTPAEEMQGSGVEFTGSDVDQSQDLPEMTEKQMNIAIKKVAAGEWTVDYIKQNSRLTEGQEKALLKMERNAKGEV